MFFSPSCVCIGIGTRTELDNIFTAISPAGIAHLTASLADVDGDHLPHSHQGCGGLSHSHVRLVKYF